jgi:HlyD family secretion protein
MHKPPKFLPIVVLLVLLAVAAFYFFNQVSADDGALTASGTIESVQVLVSPDLAGRVDEVLAEEGDIVQAGDILVQLDPSLLEAQRNQAESVYAAAEAAWNAARQSLALVEAGPSDEQLAVAQSVVDTAQVAVEAAQESYDDLSEAQQDSTAGRQLAQAVRKAEAGLANAQAQYDLLAAGAREEQIQAAADQVAAARAQVDAAQAALAVLDVQLARLTLTAPVDGVVLQRAIQPGEFASPGALLLVLGKAGSLTLTVYVPEDRYGLVELGRDYTVTVDSFPEETFTGTVTYVAGQAEFTPRNVQTVESRKATVFAVRLSLPEAAGRLRPGMPADVNFGAD